MGNSQKLVSFFFFLSLFQRIHKYASCSNECFILALIYIDRLIQRNNFLLTELNVHRVVITAILLAAKFFDDAYYNNAYYSKVGGVLVSEMNGLEVDFLFRINFSLHVTPEVFEKYKAELVAHSASAELAQPQAPPQPLPTTPEVEVSQIPTVYHAAGLPQQQQMQMQPQTSASIPIQQLQPNHPVPTQVTPSPSHVAATHSSASAPLVAPPVAEPAAPHVMYQQAATAAADQMIPNLTEPMLQRANSLPPFPSHTGRCADSHPVYNSAPMVSMLPVGGIDAEQYIMVNNQLFPLQTTLVHHHHGQASFHHQHQHHQQHGNGYTLTTESMAGSLVAGHY